MFARASIGWRAGIAALLAAAVAVPAQAASAVLQGLDKITARVSTFDAPIDKPVRFGTLRITVHACNKRPPEEPPETTAFLEIEDERQNQPPQQVFMGWMFASSPALNALQHPVYDVWVVDCKP
jgi:hypothetical protein